MKNKSNFPSKTEMSYSQQQLENNYNKKCSYSTKRTAEPFKA